MNNKLENLERLVRLKDSGAITEEEFNIEKNQLLQTSNDGQSTAEPLAASINLPVEEDSLFETSKSTVLACALIAGAIGLIPLPVTDSPLIIITQMVMLKKLCGRFNRPMGVALFLVVASAMCGPIIFSTLAKIIPGLGSLVGAIVGGGCTWLVGRSTLSILEKGLPFNLTNFKNAFFGLFKSA